MGNNDRSAKMTETRTTVQSVILPATKIGEGARGEQNGGRGGRSAVIPRPRARPGPQNDRPSEFLVTKSHVGSNLTTKWICGVDETAALPRDGRISPVNSAVFTP